MLRLSLLALLAICLPGLASAEDLGHRTSGLYVKKDAEGANNVMEIVPLSRSRAYIRIKTFWANYALCEASGVFAVESDRFVYQNRQGPEPCEMTVSLDHGRWKFAVTQIPSGEDLQVCLGSCGARGSFSRESRLRLSQRRPIRYMPKLLASPHYEAALAHDAGRLARSDTFDLKSLPEVEAAEAYETEMARP